MGINTLGLSKMKESSSINETFKLAYKNHEEFFYKKAEDLYKKVLNINPNHFESIFLLGTLYAQTKIFNQALKFLNRAKDMQPNNADVHNNLGGVLKELEGAIAQHDKELMGYLRKIDTAKREKRAEREKIRKSKGKEAKEVGDNLSVE